MLSQHWAQGKRVINKAMKPRKAGEGWAHTGSPVEGGRGDFPRDANRTQEANGCKNHR